jgi:DNA-directed RNA polymerase subunit beta'
MRTFHTGGVAGEDITQGLPRVEELFEARKPKGQAIIAEVSGTVTAINEVRVRRGREIEITDINGEKFTYTIPYGSRFKVNEGDRVEAGDELTEGSVNPHDLLKVKGVRGVQVYLLREVQRVYRLQGVDINDKHIEIMIRQMLRKVKVEDEGDTDLLPGTLVDAFEFEEVNREVEARGGRPATARPVLLGITRASLATDSFLAAASLAADFFVDFLSENAFNGLIRVLTEAAIKGRVDPLLGLKENVIIGKLIPAGTGMSRYRQLKVVAAEAECCDEAKERQTADRVLPLTKSRGEEKPVEKTAKNNIPATVRPGGRAGPQKILSTGYAAMDTDSLLVRLWDLRSRLQAILAGLEGGRVEISRHG